jgi:predicted transcriptional regulator
MQGQARDIMTREVVTAAPGDDVWVTAAGLVAQGYGGVPVLDDAGDLVGMVSGFDVLSKRGETIGEIMSRGVVFLDETASLDEVVELMGLHGIRRGADLSTRPPRRAHLSLRPPPSRRLAARIASAIVDEAVCYDVAVSTGACTCAIP